MKASRAPQKYYYELFAVSNAPWHVKYSIETTATVRGHKLDHLAINSTIDVAGTDGYTRASAARALVNSRGLQSLSLNECFNQNSKHNKTIQHMVAIPSVKEGIPEPEVV